MRLVPTPSPTTGRRSGLRPRGATLFSAAVIGLTVIGPTVVASAPVRAQEDEAFDDEDLEALDDLEGSTPSETPAEGEKPSEGKAPAADDDEAADSKTRPADLPDFDAVRPTDREPPAEAPLIANKLFPMQFRFEGTAVFDYSYSDKWTSHVGGHLSLAFHVFDFLAVEGWAGGFYPRELPITSTVRQYGYSPNDLGVPPRLTDLHQTFAFGGLGLQWAPIYGKMSMVSEFDMSFQLYFVGGFTVEGIARPAPVGGGVINNTYDFYPGLISGQGYDFAVRPSITYGAGLRIIPWKWVALRVEVRNFTGISPPVNDPEFVNEIDISNLPMINLGLSILL